MVRTVVGTTDLSMRMHKVDRSGDCWVWTGAADDDGYGTIRVGGRIYRTHRLAYEQWIGPIPDGMCVCHACDNPPCINPDHLWVGTSAENTEDRVKKNRSARGPRPKRVM